MSRRCFGGTDLTPSIPAVFFPWLSCVTRRTASSRAALDAHQSFLECVDCSLVATLFGFEDALLYAVDMLLQRAPGQLVPTFTDRGSGVCLFPGAFICAIHLTPLHSLSPCLRQPIQQLSCWRLLACFSNPTLKCVRVVPFSLYRPTTRALLRVIPFQ